MRIHYFQHVAFEGLGYIDEWLRAINCTISSTCFFDTEFTFPNIADIDALIIMGGPMSIYDENEYAWLVEEKGFIKQCINADKRILGNCKNYQWLFELFKNSPTVLHWHGEKFTIPTHNINLLDSKANSNQAFILDGRIIALQFHLEVTEVALQEMMAYGVGELVEDAFVQSIWELKSGTKYIKNCNKIMASILKQWLSS